MAHFTVIGLGRFGISACQELIHLGHTVTGVDSDVKVAEMYSDYLTQVVICDCTDENALSELDLKNSDTVLVAIGEDMQSSVLCTLSLKNIGVKNLWVKAGTKAHHTIISKLGVSRIVHPEEEMGVRVAQALNYPMVNDYIALGDGLYVVEINIKPQLHGSPLSKLLVDTKGAIDTLLIKRQGKTFTRIACDFTVKAEDTLLLCGKRAALKHIAPKLG
ncbi:MULTISPECIES: potassium channel family protein [Alteromonadaceae]|uniref:potassium channel family protein n=1 Tax=Alteromonadaceae TaxID=72275 RepID=UPI001C0A5F8E|nr:MULTISPECIES: TrkA family potassium uptake protein [Aliiglaciecola]MBU2877089.1 TrkA family potassium uptake protein [Aliiglaciecola lipolytica]MDO6710192.1 TrkA family potassium uptake protein [Aliiglaciecola sp. 2_MG-2023]MDO6751340.1 TrkA family potassium uptake protein [Aliiglaciecola sp. 1_MG-2023]